MNSLPIKNRVKICEIENKGSKNANQVYNQYSSKIHKYSSKIHKYTIKISVTRY